MALFGDKNNGDLSHWAKLRDAEDDGFVAISRAWSAVKDRWSESLEGKLTVTCMMIVFILVVGIAGFWLNSYFPTFDSSR